jgi:hypothetical protein
MMNICEILIFWIWQSVCWHILNLVQRNIWILYQKWTKNDSKFTDNSRFSVNPVYLKEFLTKWKNSKYYTKVHYKDMKIFTHIIFCLSLFFQWWTITTSHLFSFELINSKKGSVLIVNYLNRTDPTSKLLDSSVNGCYESIIDDFCQYFLWIHKKMRNHWLKIVVLNRILRKLFRNFFSIFFSSFSN